MTDRAAVERTARAILDRLGPGVAGWRVLSTSAPPPPLLVTVGLSDEESWGGYFTPDADPQWAVVALATHLPDHAIEHTHGAPLPPCPGHPHPLNPTVHDGVAQWVCPRAATHHSEAILPA